MMFLQGNKRTGVKLSSSVVVITALLLIAVQAGTHSSTETEDSVALGATVPDSNLLCDDLLSLVSCRRRLGRRAKRRPRGHNKGRNQPKRRRNRGRNNRGRKSSTVGTAPAPVAQSPAQRSPSPRSDSPAKGAHRAEAERAYRARFDGWLKSNSTDSIRDVPRRT